MHIIISSCPPDRAQALADALVEQQRAACVTIVPQVASTYRWQGTVQHENEALLLIKVPKYALDACLASLRAVHPYEVPEILVLDPTQVDAAYLAWARAQVPRGFG